MYCNQCAKAIQERCLQNSVSGQNLNEPSTQKQVGPQPQATASPVETKVHENNLQPTSPSKGNENILDALVQPEYTSDFLPYQLKRSKKKRKRKNLNNNQ
jgi:hypothetical protein